MIRFFLYVFLVFFNVSASADTYLASFVSATYDGRTIASSNQADICLGFWPNSSSRTFSSAEHIPTAFLLRCWYVLPGGSTIRYDAAANYACPYGGTLLPTNPRTCNVGPCPAGQERINGQCVPLCPVNYDRNAAGQCVRDCTAKQGQPTENGSYQFTGAVSTWSVSGCRVRCPVRTLAAGGGRGDECVYTGASADPDDPPAEPDDRPDPDLDPPPEEPDDCLRRGQGYISGSNGISCVAPSEAPPGNRPVTENDKTDESGSPGPDGKPDPNSPDYKRNDSTAKNNGDGTITENGTETRKGTPDGDGYTCPDGYTKIGNGMCQKQWSKTQDENTFCQQNPKSPLCTGKLNDCEEGTDLARCVQLGKAPEGDTVQQKQVGVSSINPVSVATGGGCPAGISLPKGLGNFNWEPICTFASAMHPIVLVLAWLSAFFIIFGLKDN